MIPDFAETLQAAQRGDDRAVGRLWHELHPQLLRFLRSRDPMSAEDVASETWLRVARSLPRFHGDEGDLRAWFFTVARNALIDWQRRARRRPLETWVDGALEERATAHDPAADALDALDTARALQLIGRLPADQAEIVLLRVVAGLDAARVGSIVGKRPGTVRVLQHRALRRLAELLGADVRKGEAVTP